MLTMHPPSFNRAGSGTPGIEVRARRHVGKSIARLTPGLAGKSVALPVDHLLIAVSRQLNSRGAPVRPTRLLSQSVE